MGAANSRHLGMTCGRKRIVPEFCEGGGQAVDATRDAGRVKVILYKCQAWSPAGGTTPLTRPVYVAPAPLPDLCKIVQSLRIFA